MLRCRINRRHLRLGSFVLHEFVVTCVGAVNYTQRPDFNNMVSDRLNKLMIVTGKDQGAGEINQRVIQTRNTFQIKMIRGIVHNEHIGFTQHHFGQV